MRLRTRLQRLEQRLPDPGCSGCRDRRGRIVWLELWAGPDGTAPASEEPAPCPVCGEVPEFIIELVDQEPATHVSDSDVASAPEPEPSGPADSGQGVPT